MATKKASGKKYGAGFSRDMANDPNMGANPAWRRKNPNFKAGSFKVTKGGKKK